MSQPYEQLKLENQLCFPLYACARKIMGAYTPLLKPIGLTYTQYIVFMVLWEKEQVSVGELGRELHLDAGTLTPLLKNLEKYFKNASDVDFESETNGTFETYNYRVTNSEDEILFVQMTKIGGYVLTISGAGEKG